MAAVTICSDFGAQENKVCHCFHFFPICHEVARGLDAMILDFWMLNFKPAFSLSSFKRLFSSSSLSAIRVISSAYLRLLIFLPTILIPAWASSSLSFHVMYSIYKLKRSRVTSFFSNFLLITSFVVWLLENVIYSFIYTTLPFKITQKFLYDQLCN